MRCRSSRDRLLIALIGCGKSFSSFISCVRTDASLAMTPIPTGVISSSYSTKMVLRRASFASRLIGGPLIDARQFES